MGLLFPMPVSEQERDRIKKSEGKIILQSYGLPLVFWGYLIGVLIILLFLFLASKGPLSSMMASDDSINILLASSIYSLFVLILISIFCFYFYEKSLVKKQRSLDIIHKVFWIPVIRKHHVLASIGEPFIIEHHLDSSNMARMGQDPSLRAFYNQGYYILFAVDEKGKKIPIDRHSRKSDLKKVALLLERY